MSRREQRAAVLVGNDRNGIAAELRGLSRDLLLIHADERSEDGQRRHITDYGEVLQRLRRDLPDNIAGDERLGAARAANLFRDAHHQASIDDHPHGPGHA